MSPLEIHANAKREHQLRAAELARSIRRSERWLAAREAELAAVERNAARTSRRAG